jgi:hypothetical protein
MILSWVVMNPIQTVLILISVIFFAGGAMGQLRPPTLTPDQGTRIIGKESALEKEDAMFIDFIKTIRADYSSPFLFQPSKIEYHKTETGRVNLRVDDYVLEQIPYGKSGDPTASDSASTMFWKTKDRVYFLMVIGGIAGRPQLFGPFRLKGGTFLFGRKP